MNRRAFVTGLGAVLAAPLAVEAQQAGGIYRIGFLGAGAELAYTDPLRTFRARKPCRRRRA